MFREVTVHIIKKYGQRCEILPFNTQEKLEAYALINPMKYKSEEYLSGKYTVSGYHDGGLYLYVGEPEIALENMPLGTTVRCGGNIYSIKHSEQYFVDEKAIYTRAILQLMARSDADD